MSSSNRETRVTLRLSSAEIAKLDEFRGSATRSAFLRRLLDEVEPGDVSDVMTHTEVLASLSQMTKAGKVTAAIHLERALREHAGDEQGVPEWLRDA